MPQPRSETLQPPANPRDFLLAAQNPDGGWGYYPRKASWLESTCWAALALGRDAASEKAFALIRSWQLPSGAWKPAARIGEPSWATALALLVHSVRDIHDQPYRRSLAWLLAAERPEGDLLGRKVWFRPGKRQ